MADETPRNNMMVELVKVSKTYPPDVTALDNVSLAVADGELIFLTGMSGAGKTTLLKLIFGMEQPDKGVVEVAGRDLNRIKGRELPHLRQRIGMAHQDFKLLPDRTVFQNIAMAMEVSYKNNRTIKDRTGELLEHLNLSPKRDTMTGRLSRGEQQRVAIARAVANGPALLLADEPTGNLDSRTTELVMDLFRQCTATGTTIILATHDERIYGNSDHRILELRAGHLRDHSLAEARMP